MTQNIFNARTMNRSLGLVRGIAIAVLVLALVGCAQVKPQADFAQARQLFTQSTGLTDIYDPDQPLLTPEELQAVLADGLSLQEALRVALLNNRKLHAAFMSIGVAKADWVQSGLFSNPTFAFSAQFPEGGGRSNIQASVAQNIVDLWQIPRRKAIARAALDECGDAAGGDPHRVPIQVDALQLSTLEECANHAGAATQCGRRLIHSEKDGRHWWGRHDAAVATWTAGRMRDAAGGVR